MRFSLSRRRRYTRQALNYKEKMKLKLPAIYVPFGPVGHPAAHAFVHLIGDDKSEVEGKLYSHLERDSGQGRAPSMFYADRVSMEAQGYYVVPIINGDEIDDNVLAALKPCALYLPVATGKGRSLADVRDHLPSFMHLEDKEVWAAGTSATPCDHDIGLESYDVLLKEAHTDKIYTSAEIDAIFQGDANFPDGVYYSTVRCTRCGEHHAYPQRQH